MHPSEPIRVLRVIARLNIGGPALHVSYLTKGLADRGYETTLVAGSVGAGEGRMEFIADRLGVSPVALPALQRDISLVLERRAVFSILRLIREHRPHVLHTHTAKAGAIGRVAARLSGRDRPPVVVHTFHGHVLRGYFPPAKSAAFAAVERSLARTTDALVAVSPEVRDDLVELGVAPASKISVVRLGLDLASRTQAARGAREQFRASLGVPPERFLVGWLGRMTDIKRPHDLVTAVARAREAGADVDLVLVGDGPLRPGLEERARRLLGASGHFTGFTEDVGTVYAGIDAVALTSANEGTPVTVIEALAAGKPAVSTAVGGVPDVVRHGENGLLASPGDVEGVAAAIHALASDRSRAAALGRRGRDIVLGRYDVPRLIGDIDELYRSLLETRDPARIRTFGPISRPLRPALPPRPTRRRRGRALRIALLSQYFPPEVGATQSRIQSFADHLAEAGHDVTVVCEFPNHPHGRIPAEYEGRWVVDDRSNAYRILRVWVRANPEKTQRTRMAFYLSYMATATLVAPMIGRPDVVVATSPPLFTGLAGAMIARAAGAPLVLDVRDLWPAAAVSLGQLSNTLALRGSQALERLLYREAAAVVAVTAPFCRHIDAARARPPRTSLIPNGTLEQFFGGCPDGVRARLGVPGDAFLVTFAGNLGIAQALPTVLDAAELAGPPTHVAFVGDGPLRERLVDETRQRGLANVHFHPQVALDEVPPFLAASDALVVTLSAHPTFVDFVPSKMLDFMASGKPVVLGAAGEAARILDSAGAGIAVPPEDPPALATALRSLREAPERAAAYGRNGQRFAISRLRSAQAERLEAVLEDVVRSWRRTGNAA